MSDDIELSWKLWHQQFRHIMSQTIPSRLLPSRRNLPLQIKSIVRFVKKRNQLFKRAKRTGNFGQFKLAWYCHYVQLFLQTKPKARKEILENCQAHEQEQAINPNLVA